MFPSSPTRDLLQMGELHLESVLAYRGADYVSCLPIGRICYALCPCSKWDVHCGHARPCRGGGWLWHRKYMFKRSPTVGIVVSSCVHPQVITLCLQACPRGDMPYPYFPTGVAYLVSALAHGNLCLKFMLDHGETVYY